MNAHTLALAAQAPASPWKAKQAQQELDRQAGAIPMPPALCRLLRERLSDKESFIEAAKMIEFFELKKQPFKVKDGQLMVKRSPLAEVYRGAITKLKPFLIELLEQPDCKELAELLRSA
ncbi:hypothetical protein [Bacteriophage sp.]|nr:hypothetical protein [Bacteriophage sp.]